MQLEVRHFIDAAHILPDTEYLCTKGCARLHGHTYAFIVRFMEAHGTLKGGMVLDFKFVKEVIDQMDHRTLVHRETHESLYQALYAMNPDQVVDFPYIPSSENISRYTAEKIMERFPNLINIEVSVCEGYKGVERANWTVVEHPNWKANKTQN